MANRHRGTVEFRYDGKTYTLSFSINAMCELEDLLGDSFGDMMAKAQDPTKVSMKTVRAMFWAGLRDHHNEMTIQDAGHLMTEIGLTEAGELVAKAFAAAMPEAAKAAGPLEIKSRPTG